ncbi:hypothetical protein GOP47_0003269 [Adiantum capillus-veneris]|uniref:Uncharacterized protein n=1 Tax=Adiantum capillus-veneris TaxID=13818 RepID=A0A9D4VD78_ADICA|nr:hypothetical protein GOP47_0003269 [Adiantum capillus-veneris]
MQQRGTKMQGECKEDEEEFGEPEGNAEKIKKNRAARSPSKETQKYEGNAEKKKKNGATRSPSKETQKYEGNAEKIKKNGAGRSPSKETQKYEGNAEKKKKGAGRSPRLGYPNYRKSGYIWLLECSSGLQSSYVYAVLVGL